MELNFIPIDYDYFDLDGRNYVRLIGRNDKGKKICVVDDYEPNFWAIVKPNTSNEKIKSIIKKIEKIKVENAGRKTRVLKTKLHDKKFLGRDVKAIQIFLTNHKDAHAVADQMGFKEIDKRREYDISLISKYITENKVQPLKWHEVEGEVITGLEFGGINNLEVDLCIKADKISLSKQQKDFEPKILAYDIETDELELGKGDILMISLYGENFKKVLTWKHCKSKQDYVECFKDEADMLEAFVKYTKEYAPDILAGYFSDGFDLPYLRAAANKNKVKLSLGLDGRQPMFSPGRVPSGKISGIVHVDLFKFIQTVYAQYLKSETLSLNEVCSELLGEKKCDFAFHNIGLSKMTDHDWRDFYEYNLQDSALTYKLAEKLWPDMLELTKTVQEPLFKVNRYGLSGLVENYIVHNLTQFNEIAEKRPLHDEIIKRRAKGKVEGAFVLQPKTGLHENIGMFDFTSMHTSIIISFNISKTTLLEKKEKGCYESPEVEIDGKKTKLYFSKEPGFIPLLLKDIFEKRKKFKAEYKSNPNPITKARSNVFKLLSASVHGYQGFFGARYYSHEAAAAVLAFVRKFDKQVIDKTIEEGYNVIYSDTDSISFLIGKKSKKQVYDFLHKLNSELPGIMELELEDFYKRGLFVSKRTTKSGAKKKYALIDEKGKLKIRGFETVRRDWCILVRELQNNVLKSILKDGNEKQALKLLKEVIQKIKNREIDKKQILIRTQLKKPINEYIAQGPHVIAAKKMEERDIPVSQGMLIEYFIAETKTGSKKTLVREKVKLPDEKGKYNIKYYLNNQILPAVENIFEVFGINVGDVAAGEKQKRLF